MRRGEVADRVRFREGRVGGVDGCFGLFAQGVRVWMRDREAGQGLWDRPGQVGAVQVRAGSARRDECCRPAMVGLYPRDAIVWYRCARIISGIGYLYTGLPHRVGNAILVILAYQTTP